MDIQTHKKDFSMQMWNPYKKKEKHAVWDSSCTQRKQYSQVLAPPAGQPPAFQLFCQQYINLTNTEGCDLVMRAEPNLTSELRSDWVEDHNSNHHIKKKKS